MNTIPIPLYKFNNIHYMNINDNSILIQDYIDEGYRSKNISVGVSNKNILFLDIICNPKCIMSDIDIIRNISALDIDEIEDMIKFSKFYGLEKCENILNNYYANHIFPILSLSEIKDKFYQDHKHQCFDKHEIMENISRWKWIWEI